MRGLKCRSDVPLPRKAAEDLVLDLVFLPESPAPSPHVHHLMTLCELVRLKTLLHSLHTQSRLTLCDHMDCSLSGSTVHGILQARILEWVAIPFSRGSSWPRDLFIFNWRIPTLQYYIGFCHTSTWISHRCTYVPSLVNLPPTSHSIPPLEVVTEPPFEFPES